MPNPRPIPGGLFTHERLLKMLMADQRVTNNPFVAPDVRCARCAADANHRYYNYVQQVWQAHAVQANAESAAIVRRLLGHRHKQN